MKHIRNDKRDSDLQTPRTAQVTHRQSAGRIAPGPQSTIDQLPSQAPSHSHDSLPPHWWWSEPKKNYGGRNFLSGAYSRPTPRHFTSGPTRPVSRYARTNHLSCSVRILLRPAPKNRGDSRGRLVLESQGPSARARPLILNPPCPHPGRPRRAKEKKDTNKVARRSGAQKAWHSLGRNRSTAGIFGATL